MAESIPSLQPPVSPAEANVFQNMRVELSRKFSKLTSLVNRRKRELDLKIDNLEIEFYIKTDQIEKDNQTLLTLRENAEQQLGNDTLLDVQSKIVKEIEDKIEKLKKEYKLQLELIPKVKSNIDVFKVVISQMDVKMGPKEKKAINFKQTRDTVSGVGKNISKLAHQVNRSKIRSNSIPSTSIPTSGLNFTAPFQFTPLRHPNNL